MSMRVLILDSHLGEDGRIKRHTKYLVDQGLQVYRIHFNFIEASHESGVFSHYGEKGFRINVSFFQGKIRHFNFYLYCLRKKILNDCFTALDILSFNRELPSIIHVHDPYLLPLAEMLINNGLSNSKIIYDRHELYEDTIQFFGINIPCFYEHRWGKFISGVVIVSDHHLKKTQELFPNLPIVSISNFPLSSMYDQNVIKNKIQSFNQESQISAIYIGSLIQTDRDIDLLLKIADITLQSYDNVNFIIGGACWNAQLEAKMAYLSSKYSDRFQFLGYVPNKRTIELTQKAHIGFFLIRPETSYWVKSSPNKVFEYLLCATVPIIRADVDHYESLNTCSLIFKRFDDEHIIIQSVIDLIGNSERLKKVMQSCNNLSLKYTWESVACRYIEIYNRLLNSEL